MAEAMPDNNIAMTEAHGGSAHHEESAFSPSSPEFWVYAGLTIFILLAIFVAKAPKRIAQALDTRIAETKAELERARELRAEAEALLAEAKAKQTQSHQDAEAIVAQAKEEAADLVKELEANATDLIARRQKMAEDKIGAAERAAIADVRARTAAAATAAAATLLKDTHGAKADKALVDEVISKLAH